MIKLIRCIHIKGCWDLFSELFFIHRDNRETAGKLSSNNSRNMPHPYSFQKKLIQREISKIVFENVGSEGLLKDGEDESKVFVRMIR